MNILVILSAIAAIIIIGFLGEIIFKKFKIPDVLILIVIGIILGSGFGLVSDDIAGAGIFTTFALLFILFQGSLNINFKSVLSSFKDFMSLTFLTFIMTVLGISLISTIFGYSMLESLLIGFILGGTSSSVVIPLVNVIHLTKDHSSVLKLESAISDVLCIIGTLTIINILQSGAVVTSEIFRTVLSSFAMAIVVGGVLGFITVYLQYKYEAVRKNYILIIGLLIGVYVFVESPFIAASGAIAALTFGLMIGNSKAFVNLFNSKIDKPENIDVLSVLSPTAKNFYSEISFFVKAFFFVYVGILMDFSHPMVFVIGGLFVLASFLLRPFAVWSVFRKKTMEQKERTYLEILIPKGLAAAVLAQLAVQSGVFGDKADSFVGIILAAVVISIVVTSILVFLTDKGWYKGGFIFLRNHEIPNPVVIEKKK
jgi:cell volume regulation protein A